MSKDKDLESILGQPLFFDESQEDQKDESEDDLSLNEDNKDVVSIIEPLGISKHQKEKENTDAGNSSRFTNRDFSIFIKNPATPLEVHFTSASEIKKSLQEMSINQAAQEVVKPVMYELKKHIEDIIKLTEEVVMDLNIPSLDTKAHKTYYNFFETKKTDNKINFIILKLIYEFMGAYNRILLDYWLSLQTHFDKLALFPKTKETFQKILQKEVLPRLELIKLTDEFLQYQKKYLHVTNETFSDSKKKLTVVAEYYDSLNYSWDSFNANLKDKRNEAASHLITKPSNEANDSDNSIPFKNEIESEDQTHSDTESKLSKAKQKKPEPLKKGVKTNIVREKIKATEIINPIDIVNTKSHNTNISLKYIPVSPEMIENGRIESIQLGSKEWNTGHLYTLTVLLEELEKEESIIDIAFHLSCDEQDKYEKVKYSAAIVRAGTAKNDIENYKNMIANTFHKLEQIDIPSEMTCISAELFPSFLYHLGPVHLFDIFMSTLKKGRYGFISYINKSKSIETTYLTYFIKLELILWWNRYFGNFSTEKADQYLNYSKVIEALKDQYIIDLTNARTKQKEFIELHAAKIVNFNAEDHFKKHWKQFFSSVKVPVYKRFLTKSIFRN